MNMLKRLLIICLPLLTASCGDEDRTDSRAITANNFNATSMEFQANRALDPAVRNVGTTDSGSQADLSAVPRSVDVKPVKQRPNFSDFVDGGKILRKIKTRYIQDNSWLVVYETRDEFPSLQVMVLIPDKNNRHQKVMVDTFRYDGATPRIKELFFFNVDKDPEKELVILCAWEVSHQGLGINATDYNVYIYDNERVPGTNKVKKLNKLMEKFGAGTEGKMEAGRETYPWKDKAAILKALKSLSLP